MKPDATREAEPRNEDVNLSEQKEIEVRGRRQQSRSGNREVTDKDESENIDTENYREPKEAEVKVEENDDLNDDENAEISIEDLEIQLLPPILPPKLSNALLLQYIINSDSKDQLDFLLPFGFALGCISLAIAVHSTAMQYVFNSFGAFLPYYPDRVKKVRKAAHGINNTLCIVQVLMAIAMFGYCIYWKDRVSHDDKDEENYKYFVQKRIWMLSFIVSSLTFGCTIIAAGAAILLFTIFKFKEKKIENVSPRVMDKVEKMKVPPSAATIIDMGLSNVLVGLYIGIEDDTVGEKVDLQVLCLWVGTITFMMVMLDTITNVTLHIVTKDGRLDVDESLFLKVMHYLR